MQKPTALVVEDEALIALDMEDVLLAEGFDTILAMSHAEAMKVAAANFAVAVVSVRLCDDIAGKSIIRALRKNTPDLPIVVVTGFASTSPEADLRGLGWPTARLGKPTERSDLAAAVRSVIAQAKSGVKPPCGRRKTD